MEVYMTSHGLNVRRDIYRKLLADDLVSKKPALSLKFHIAEPDADGFRLVASKKHHVGDAPA